MADEPRYLTGFGERLARTVHVPSGGGAPDDPYTVEQARTRLGRMARMVSEQAAELPDIACPNDRVVMAITLHPKYLSKSAYPRALFEEIDVTPVGSRPVEVIPELDVRTRDKEREVYQPADSRPPTRIFVDSSRSNLQRWAEHLASREPLPSRKLSSLTLARGSVELASCVEDNVGDADLGVAGELVNAAGQFRLCGSWRWGPVAHPAGATPPLRTSSITPSTPARAQLIVGRPDC